MKRVICMLAVMVMLASFAITASADEVTGGISVESVMLKPPLVDVYVSGCTAADISSASASLGGEQLSYKGARKYDPSADKTCVYILLDVSSSVSSKYFDSFIDCVKKMLTEASGETFILYTFDAATTRILDGTETMEQAIEKLNGLSSGHGYTTYYDSLYLVHNAALGNAASYDRQYVFTFSDGENEDANAKRSLGEVKEVYSDGLLPIYTMCMKTADDEQREIVGELSRTSGGQVAVFSPADAVSALDGLLERVRSCVRLSFEKPNNYAQDTSKSLTVSINGTELPPVTVFESSQRRVADDVKPAVVSASYSLEENCLVIEYSEAVYNADSVQSYIIKDNKGAVIAPSSASYDAATNTARLYFDGNFYTGTYTLGYQGITDGAYPANALDSPEMTVDLTAKSGIYKLAGKLWLLLIPLLIAVIVLVVLLLVKKTRKINTVKELFEVESENNYEVKHHIVAPGGGKQVMLTTTTGNLTNTVKTVITSSLIVGRSDVCDLYIDDVKLSRQHFAIEAVPGGLTLVDLNSTNGTFLNGRAITGKTQLNPNDVIAAGKTTIKVEFQ